ncbi:laccase domain protein [Mycobacterium montefiorense]|uniref:Purine nucleoside phosphorylase n=1 Tax=Mycobacterium montefiorense TaxID=154654 RepID=A0AA37PPC8_9MYCO|nr:laccase domain protein [Mycobacterium montefiorense]GKU34129.1 laccase domain protein [Mycobacterium montefiorense]GKU39697.1 laccase domain protein [Mycobacterium montefiorense]GKU44047.1 laccase domain protein [Mycobacterium montefiorense]GKU51997.1 laccase domain protein [Mycobacterium montefiorense]
MHPTPGPGHTSGTVGRRGISDTGHVTVRIRRVTTTRAGGVSKPPFDSFNLGDHVGDDPAAVVANRARLARAIGLGADRVVWMNQVHGDRVEVVDQPRDGAFDDTDALVTRTPRLALAVVTADCVPVLLADARAGVAAAVHAGRVGAQRGVVTRTVEAMLKLGAQADDISVLLGPAVSGRNYEVPAAMADEVEAVLPGSRATTANGTPGLDLRAGIACQLKGLGVNSIDIDPRCTVADRALFSHRRDAPTGRLASLIWME